MGESVGSPVHALHCGGHIRAASQVTHLARPAISIIVACIDGRDRMLLIAPTAATAMKTSPALHWHEVRFPPLRSPKYRWVVAGHARQEVSPSESWEKSPGLKRYAETDRSDDCRDEPGRNRPSYRSSCSQTALARAGRSLHTWVGIRLTTANYCASNRIHAPSGTSGNRPEHRANLGRIVCTQKRCRPPSSNPAGIPDNGLRPS